MNGANLEHKTEVSLRRKLMFSHLTVALFCFFVLLIALLFNIWLAKQSSILATASNPMQQLNLHQLSLAIKHSNSLVYEDIALSNIDQRGSWEKIWSRDIWPSLEQLDGNNDQLTDTQKELLKNLKGKYIALQAIQWHIMDVLSSGANFPAQVLLNGELFNVEQGISRGLDSLINRESEEFGNKTNISIIKEFADLRAAFIHLSTELQRFASNASPMAASNIEKRRDTINKGLDSLLNDLTLLTEQKALLEWLRGELQYYFTLSNKILEVGQSEEQNVAQFLLQTEMIPLITESDSLMNQLDIESAGRVEEERENVSSILEYNLSLSFLLLVAMLLSAFFSARYLTNRIVSPIERLVNATLKLGKEQRSVDVAVTSNDELGILTKAFNYMQKALLEKQHELRQLATTDALTGLANRRKFADEINKEWKRCLRNQERMSIIVMDVDNFKMFNDQFGHQAGDEALQTVATVIRKSLNRPSDLAVRYGGEEFVAVLTQTGIEGARNISQKIRQGILNRKIPAAKGAAHHFLSISCGISSCVPGGEVGSWEDLIKIGDETLYRAKSCGRNQVCESQCDTKVRCDIPVMNHHAN